jgi:adenosylmethionine-8-amino-7-oxononanoate aminotransferase
LDLAQRSLAALWHPCTPQYRGAQASRFAPLPLIRAQGPWLYDTQGRRYLDAVSSWWVNLLGHGHPALVAALQAQCAQLDHVMLAGCTHEPAVQLAEKLHQLTGLGHAFYGSDGASAIEISLKISAHSWRNQGQPEKCRFVGLAGGYHGETLGALSVTDMPVFRQAYAPLIQISHTVPTPDSRHRESGQTGQTAAQTTQKLAEHALEKLADLFEKAHHTLAAFIVEPLLQCAAGMVMYDPVYLQGARRLCDTYGVHLIADEIATGFGRTGTWFAYQQAAIVPDLLCLSKGLTGGVLPLSVVLCQDAVYETFDHQHPGRSFLHSHSYTGNPLACRAALTTIDELCRHDVLAHNAATCAPQITQALTPLFTHPRIKNPRQLGMIWACDIADAPADFSQAYHEKALQEGLLLRPIGSTWYAMPPYILNSDEIEHLGRGALRALEACF